MTNDEKHTHAQRSGQTTETNPADEPQGATWIQQMLPRFALVTQNQTSAGVQVVATHYGVGLPSGQVVLFTVGLGTIAVLPDWNMVHQLVQAGQGRMVLVMEEKEVQMEAATVA